MITSGTTLTELRTDFENKSQAAENYKTLHDIDGLETADAGYLELLIAREESYLKYKELEVGEPRFSTLHAPVILHRLDRYKDLLRHAKGGVV